MVFFNICSKQTMVMGHTKTSANAVTFDYLITKKNYLF